MEVLVYIDDDGRIQLVLDSESANSAWKFLGRARWTFYTESGNEEPMT